MEDLDTKLRRRTPDEQPHDDFGEERRVELIDVGPRGRRSSVVIPSAILLFSIVIHVALFLALPKGNLGIHRGQPSAQQLAQTKPRNKEVKIHLLRMMPVQKRADEMPVAVQATSAPENKPDFSLNTSSKNQQLAQKIISRDKTGSVPQVENGQKRKASGLETGSGQPVQRPTVSQIVETSRNNTKNPKNSDGQRARQAKELKGVVKTQDEAAAPAMPRTLLSDKPHTDGKGIAEFAKAGNADKIPEKEPKDREIPAVVTNNPYIMMEQPKAEASETSGMKPRPRPRLTLPSVRPEPLHMSDSGVERVENYVSMDSVASDYGNYMERMSDVIGSRFESLVERAGGRVTEINTHVMVSFVLDKDGQVDDVKIIESTADQRAQWICLDALKGSAPFFPWTQDMIMKMGPKASLTWEFDFL